MLKALKIRLYPTKSQERYLNTSFNNCRCVYNLALQTKITAHRDYKISLSAYELSAQLPELKEEFIWLKETKADAFQEELANLDSAYKNFFRTKQGFPKFKNKSSKQSFTLKGCISVNSVKNLLSLSREHKIKFKCSSQYQELLRANKIRRVTISRDKTSAYYASCLIDDSRDLSLPKNTRHIGIDLGLKSFLTTSEGVQIENPRYLKKSLIKLDTLQRRHSKKKKGSKNKEKGRLILAKRYKKVTNQRNDFLHKVSKRLIDDSQIISIETLSVKDMLTKELSRSISDASWSRFIEFLKYKSVWYGREIKQIGRYIPSSKTCSSCGWVDKDQTLADRIFKCRECGYEEDRDLNAAKNIKKFSLLI